MITEEKLDRFLILLEGFVDDLAGRRDLNVHNNINQYYYMTKIAELKVLKDQLQESFKRFNFVSDSVENQYKIVFRRWRSDVQWLKDFQNLKDSRKSSVL